MAGGALNLDTALLYVAEALETITGIEALPDASETRAGRIARIEHVADNAVEITGGGGGGGLSAWGGITGTLSAQLDLQSALNAKLVAADLTPYALSATVTAGLDGKQPVGDYATNTALTSGLATKEATGVAAGLIAALTKASVGLGNVDNTSDANKPVSTAQLTALNAKLDDSQATAFGLSLLDDADASAGRTTLGLTALATTTPGTGIAAALGVNVGSAGAPVLFNGALGTPTSGTLTNCTFPTLNQSTTGSAATLTTSRNFSIAGGGITAAVQGFNGSAAVVLNASVDAGHITLARMADVATGTVFYRKTAATGAPEVQTLATLKTDLGLTGTNGGDQTTIVGITGTLAQFNTAITDADILSVATAASTYQPLDTQLTDLATLAYAGNALKYIRINAAANGFEVVTLAGGGDLLAANNLSDVASVATARTNLGVEQNIAPVKYDAAGAAQGAAIADYFTSTISLDANSTYEIEATAYFLKTTAGTVIWTWTFSSAPIFAQSFWQAGPITGFTTAIVTGTALFGHAVQEASLTLAHAASGSLTTAVRHSFMFSLRVRTNAATTLQLRSTQSAGTLTPQPGSYMKARKIA